MAILTITGGFGTRADEVGRAVADTLRYEYVDRQKILASLGQLGGDWRERGKDFDQHCPTVWEKFDWSYAVFKAQMQGIYLEYAAKGNVVPAGRGGNFLLSEVPYALRVCVTAPPETRVDWVTEKEDVAREVASFLIEKADHDSSCYVHSLYGRDWDDPSEYDLVLDVASAGVAATASKIVAALGQRQQLETEETKGKLALRARAAKVKAVVVSDPDLFLPTLDVVVGDGQIVLRGIVHGPEQRKRVEEAARAAAGNMPVKSELHYRT